MAIKQSADKHFEFNRWWTGIEPFQETPISGALQRQERIRIKLEQQTIIEGIVQKREEKKVEFVKVTEQQKKINKQILKKKTELNRIPENLVF